MLEKECDEVLEFLYLLKYSPAGGAWLCPTLGAALEGKYDDSAIENIIATLYSEEFVQTYNDDKRCPTRNNGVYFTIAPKGISFNHSDRYVERRERLRIEREIKKIEYRIKGKTFWIAIFGVCLSLYNTCKSPYKDSNDSDSLYKQYHIGNSVHHF